MYGFWFWVGRVAFYVFWLLVGVVLLYACGVLG